MSQRQYVGHLPTSRKSLPLCFVIWKNMDHTLRTKKNTGEVMLFFHCYVDILVKCN